MENSHVNNFIESVIKSPRKNSDSPLIFFCGKTMAKYVKKNFPTLKVVQMSFKEGRTKIFYKQYERRKKLSLQRLKRNPYTTRKGIYQQLNKPNY